MSKIDAQDYSCKVGMAFCGGAGNKMLIMTIDDLDPFRYRDFRLFGTNTDEKIQHDFFVRGQEKNESLKKWIEAKALTIHPLGGRGESSLTKGRGAGADPEVGRRAALSEVSQAAMREFFESVDEVFVIGGLGGGTGTGAIPVAAKLAKELGKTTVVIVALPEPDEGRDERALQGYEELRALKIPIFRITNQSIDKFMEKLPIEERDRLTTRQIYQKINENSFVPMIRSFREMVQEPGDAKQFDQADWHTATSSGDAGVFGIAEVDPDKIGEVKATEIVNEILDFMGRFQDPKILEWAQSVVMWGHGPWPRNLLSQVRKHVRSMVIEKSKNDKIEVHWGLQEEVQDNKIWVAVTVIGKDQKGIGVATLASSTAPLAPPIRSSQRVLTPLIVNGVKTAPVGLWSDLAERYSQYQRDDRTPISHIDDLYSAIQEMTGLRPDYPEWMKGQNTSKVVPITSAR